MISTTTIARIAHIKGVDIFPTTGVCVDMFPHTDRILDMFPHTVDIHSGVSGHTEAIALLSNAGSEASDGEATAAKMIAGSAEAAENIGSGE